MLRETKIASVHPWPLALSSSKGSRSSFIQSSESCAGITSHDARQECQDVTIGTCVRFGTCVRYKAMGGPVSGMRRHHLIPLETIDNFRSLFTRAAEGGFNMSGGINGMFVRAGDHLGRHQGYTGTISGALDDVLRNSKGLSPTEVAAQIENIANLARRGIGNRTFTPSF